MINESEFFVLSSSIGNSYYFCKPHAENVAFNWMDLSAVSRCLRLKQFNWESFYFYTPHPEIAEFNKMDLYARLVVFYFERIDW